MSEYNLIMSLIKRLLIKKMPNDENIYIDGKIENTIRIFRIQESFFKKTEQQFITIHIKHEQQNDCIIYKIITQSNKKYEYKINSIFLKVPEIIFFKYYEKKFNKNNDIEILINDIYDYISDYFDFYNFIKQNFNNCIDEKKINYVYIKKYFFNKNEYVISYIDKNKYNITSLDNTIFEDFHNKQDLLNFDFLKDFIKICV